MPVILIIAWQVAYDFNAFPSSQASSPKLIIKTLIDLIAHSDLLTNLFLSVVRLLLGVLTGGLLGICFGIVTSTNKYFQIIFAPTIQFLSGIPVIIWIPFWIMVFGIGDFFKVGLVSISTFFLIYSSTFLSILSIDSKYLELGVLFRKSYLTMVRLVYLPYSLYSILGAVRLSLMIGWIVIFFVEYSISFEGKEGIGWFIANARGVGRVEEEFAGLIMLGITAFTFDLTVGYIQNRSIAWKK